MSFLGKGVFPSLNRPQYVVVDHPATEDHIHSHPPQVTTTLGPGIAKNV
jgi:hypothetical protein